MLNATIAETSGDVVDGVIVAPAFGEAGRVTVGAVHYAGSPVTGIVPVGQTEFARHATFGYTASDLRQWVAEKSEGRHPDYSVIALTLDVVRPRPAGGGGRARRRQRRAVRRRRRRVEESDQRSLAIDILRANESGKRFVYRVGPPFVRALVGQEVLEPLTADDVAAIRTGGLAEDASTGLVVVGSHVALTTRQLDTLRARRYPAELEIDVAQVLGSGRDDHLDSLVTNAVAALQDVNVVIRTTRTLVTGTDGDSSLRIACTVSDAVVEVVQSILLAARPLRFVVAKGGITSSDVASRDLGITRAVVRGAMLPGIVSLWAQRGSRPRHPLYRLRRERGRRRVVGRRRRHAHRLRGRRRVNQGPSGPSSAHVDLAA